MIAVLLPTFNQARFLPECLAALRAQTRTDFEVIACNDGSTDETAQILADAGIRTVTHDTNRGTAAAINSALAAISDDARFVTWVSSDNTMHPGWLEKLAGVLEADAKLAAVYSPYRRLDDSGGKIRPRVQEQGPYDPARLIGGLDCYFGPSFLVRREAWLEHREGLAHDYDWWLRFEENHKGIGYYPKPLCDYRMGPWQTGRVRPGLLEDAKRRQAEAVERRPKRNAMINPGVKNRNLTECIRLATAGCLDVVELGCGFGNRLAEVNATVRVGVDAHEPYITEARRRHPGIEFVVADACEFVRHAERQVGAVLMIDFLEHLPREDAKALVADCKRAFERIVLYVPLGKHPQNTDPHQMGGDAWQTHRSTWEVVDLEALGFNVKEWPTIPNRPGIEPRAAFCVWAPTAP